MRYVFILQMEWTFGRGVHITRAQHLISLWAFVDVVLGCFRVGRQSWNLLRLRCWHQSLYLDIRRRLWLWWSANLRDLNRAYFLLFLLMLLWLFWFVRGVLRHIKLPLCQTIKSRLWFDEAILRCVIVHEKETSLGFRHHAIWVKRGRFVFAINLCLATCFEQRGNVFSLQTWVVLLLWLLLLMTWRLLQHF